MSQGKGKTLGLLLGPVLLLVLILLPPLPGALQAAQQAKLPSYLYVHLSIGIILWTATWWISECVPLGLAAFIPTILFPLMGLVSWSDALKCYMDPIMWVVMAGFVFSKAFQIWGLDRRIAFNVANIYKGNNPMLFVLLSVSLPTFLLTMTGAITAATSIVYPIALALLVASGLAEGPFAEATLIALGQAATSGAMLFLVSTAPNLIAKRVIEDVMPGFQLTFVDWFIVGTPNALLGLIISWILTFLILRPKVGSLEDARKKLDELRASLGYMKPAERKVLAIFSFTLSLWIIPGVLKLASSFYPAFSNMATVLGNILPEAAPAVLAIFLLGLIKEGDRPLLSWEEFEDGVDWNVIFLLGGSLVLGAGLQKSGFGEWISNLIMIGFGTSPSLEIITVLSAIAAFIITLPASNTAAAAVMAPIAASLAVSFGYSPLPPVLAVGLASSISSALPSTTPPMAIIYGSGKVKLKNMFKVGIISDTVRLVLLCILEPYLANILLQIKGIS